MNTLPKWLIPIAVTLALGLPATLEAEQPRPGYGYEPTEREHIGEKEYSPYLNGATLISTRPTRRMPA